MFEHIGLCHRLLVVCIECLGFDLWGFFGYWLLQECVFSECTIALQWLPVAVFPELGITVGMYCLVL